MVWNDMEGKKQEVIGNENRWEEIGKNGMKLEEMIRKETFLEQVERTNERKLDLTKLTRDPKSESNHTRFEIFYKGASFA